MANEGNITFNRTKELAIIKASNELLEDVKRGLLERESVDEGVLLQLDTAQKENLIMARTAYGASEQDVNNVQYHGPSVKEIKEYEKRLEKKNLFQKVIMIHYQVFYRKNLEEFLQKRKSQL